MIVLQQLSGKQRGRRVQFDEGPVLIGRSPDAELRFDPHVDIDVSARHAVLEKREDGWYVRDVGSRNGTFVSGRRVHERRLSDRDEIELGHGGPRLYVSLVAPKSSLAEADTEPSGRTVEAQAMPARDPEATLAVSHEADTVLAMPERPAAPIERRPPGGDEVTRDETPRLGGRVVEDDARDALARLEAARRRERLILGAALLAMAVALVVVLFSR